ncbi:transmembrane and coiled-coil domain-containing protein 4 isoform X2 [Cephus cinctus]|uniref:Transmembrane and coiled-coil domain-containing protein 4 isoform X2 n=1 Tax=Cephus cinctus TaxID=211228 RepID=A0AAJ7BFS4_CEPCN|nr:transmembrane and coiled-coil domain-containing protein 4 isoform X2 [Cephus cinctus]
MSERRNKVQAGPMLGTTNISETAAYAYAAICSIILSELFPQECHQEFRQSYVKTICSRLMLNERVEPVMFILAQGNSGHTEDAYVTLLLEDPTIKGRAVAIVQDVVLNALRNGILSGEYDARHRVLARRIAELLKVPFDLVELYELSLVERLSQKVEPQTEKEQKDAKHREKIKKIKRYASIGLATITGGTLIGVTGGLAAPLIGVGVGTLLGAAGTSAALVLSTTAGAAILGSVFGVAGAGLAGYKMNKRVGEVEEFAFESLSQFPGNERQLHIAIAVTGWLNDREPDNVVRPWRCLAVSREQYALRYETKYLIELGEALNYILSMAMSAATQEALKYTVLSTLMTAIAWPAALLSISSIIDNPWSVCCRRSSEVGKQLAHVLLTREHGKRPVTLIGFSLGARVVYYCLREMAQVGGGQGIIQDAIMLGTPVTSNKEQWELCSTIVAGRMVNGYCSGDWLLKFLYRTLSMATGVAGLVPVQCDKVTNVDLSGIVHGHGEYLEKLPTLLRHVGLNTRDVEVQDDSTCMKKSSSEVPYTSVSQNTLKTDTNIKISQSATCLSSTKYLESNNRVKDSDEEQS